MSDEHNRGNGKKSKNPIDIKQKTIDMLMYSIDYIKSLTEYIRYESLVKQEKEQEVNCVKSASQSLRYSNDKKKNEKETKQLIKNKRRHESILKKDGVSESSEISLRSEKKEKNKSKYTLKLTRNENQNSYKKNCENETKENKLINQSGELYNSKKENSAGSLIKPELIDYSSQEYTEAKSSVLDTIAKIKKSNYPSKNTISVSKMPEMNKDDNDNKYSEKSTGVYIVL